MAVKLRSKLFLFLIFIGVSACVEPEAVCEEERVLQVSVAFSAAGDSRYNPSVDTTFTAVYAVGTNAEMRSRKVNNTFYLPAPAAGGDVLYVFEQGDARDTLALHLEYDVRFRDTGCPPEVRVKQAVVLFERTSYPADSVTIFTNRYAYEAAVTIWVP